MEQHYYRLQGGKLVFDAQRKARMIAEAKEIEAAAELEAKRQARVNAALLSAAAPEMDDEIALTIADAWPAWAAGNAYHKGDVVTRSGTLYRVQQAVTAQAHQPPGAAGMLAVYAPIQLPAAPDQVLPWVYGETGIAVGDKRTHGGKVWEAIQSPGANIWEPPAVPAIWREAR